MSIYSDQAKTGELWFRSLDGTINPSYISLSSIALKYQPVNIKFYNEIINNKINKFDVFYDSIYLETPTGFIFEKIVFDGNNIQPYENNNNFTLKTYIPIKYWFDELNFKIYYVEIKAGIQTANIFDFYLILTEYDCKTGELNVVYKHHIKLALNKAINWSGVVQDYPIIEKPTLCYNKDSKNYNISFIFRNNNSNSGFIISGNTIAIMSINLKNSGIFETQSINGMIPFCSNCSLLLDQNLL